MWIFQKSPFLDFNPRSREGSDSLYILCIKVLELFQPTLPRGERRCSGFLSDNLPQFQPTLPRGERLPAWKSGSPPWMISTHAPARGATGSKFPIPYFHTHFNPRSREGSDPQMHRVPKHCSISTHAPARGATSPVIPFLLPLKISTHAPARGATLFIQGFGSVELFQPTLPRGERLHKRNTSVLITEISTHAPARGATKCLCFSKSIYLFQPTLPRGERQCSQF